MSTNTVRKSPPESSPSRSNAVGRCQTSGETQSTEGLSQLTDEQRARAAVEAVQQVAATLEVSPDVGLGRAESERSANTADERPSI